MFLLQIAKKNDDLFFYFKDNKTGKFIGYPVVYDHFFLKKVDASKATVKNHIKAFIYSPMIDQKESVFEKMYCKPSKEQEERGKHRSDLLFDCGKDFMFDFMLRNEISLYTSYDSIKKTILSVDNLKKNNEILTLQHLCVKIKVEESKSGVAIPRWDKFHTIYLRVDIREIKHIETQRILEIECYDPTLDKTIYFNDKNETVLIGGFLEYFKKLNPDVVEMFNWLKMWYLYERCIFLDTSQKLVNEFISTVNRIPDDLSLNMSDILEFSFPDRQYVGIKTKCWESYEDNTNKKKSYEFKIALFGRIVVAYNMFSKEDVSNYAALVLHKEIEERDYLGGLLEHTGVDLYLPYYCFGDNTRKSMNLVKKYNKNIVFSTNIIGRLGFGGALKMGTVGLYKDSNLYDIDFNSFYPNIIKKFNLSPDTLTKSGKKVFENKEVFKFYLPKSERIGAISNTVSVLMAKREELKKEISQTFDGAKQILKRKETSVKLSTNVIYGMLGFCNHFNKLAAPNAAASITHYGRFYLQQLIDFVKFHDITVISGDTDGIKVKTDKSIKEIQELLEEFKRIHGECIIPELKMTFHSIAQINTAAWVGFDDKNNFINKGALTKVDNELLLKIKSALYRFILQSKENDNNYVKVIIDCLIGYDKSMLKNKSTKDLSLFASKKKDVQTEIDNIITKCKEILLLYVSDKTEMFNIMDTTVFDALCQKINPKVDIKTHVDSFMDKEISNVEEYLQDLNIEDFVTEEPIKEEPIKETPVKREFKHSVIEEPIKEEPIKEPPVKRKFKQEEIFTQPPKKVKTPELPDRYEFFVSLHPTEEELEK